MKKNIDYTNKNGVPFQVEVEGIQNPADADHWRYVFKSTETKSGYKRTYQVMILKALIPEHEKADIFVLGDPLVYLREACLDNYVDGSHDMFWPDLTRGWVVF